MADVNAGEEERVTSPAKRKPDLPGSIDEEEHIKKRMLESPSRNDAIACAADEDKNDLKEPLSTSHPEAGEEDDDEDDEEDYEDEEDGDELSDGEEAKVNSKGKGIARDDKGKGKLIEESDDGDDDDDDDDDCESELSDVDTDLSDDPLAEVDLDNILPSRTRRRCAQPGLHISNDGNNDHGSNA